ncbi:hypothetical protein MMC22_011370, partial [Lobaria immixta]|nr:hypothetical protein [Lobaria immixta]
MDRPANGSDSSPYFRIFDDLRRHSAQPRVSTSLAIISILREPYPTVTVTGTTAARQRVIWKYDYKWNDISSIVYEALYAKNNSNIESYFIVYEEDEEERVDGRPKAVNNLITAATQYAGTLREEMLVFNGSMWNKDKKLWQSVQEWFWDDAILDGSLKKSLVTELESLLDSRDDYKQFAVPWKAFCLLAFENIDSLVTDNVKSFFLDEVDGLESKDGIMMLEVPTIMRKYPICAFEARVCKLSPAVERLDDRIFKSKLAPNLSIASPPGLSAAIAKLIEELSFAHLKEAFISVLLLVVAGQRVSQDNKELEYCAAEKKEKEAHVIIGQDDNPAKSTLLGRVIPNRSRF